MMYYSFIFSTPTCFTNVKTNARASGWAERPVNDVTKHHAPPLSVSTFASRTGPTQLMRQHGVPNLQRQRDGGRAPGMQMNEGGGNRNGGGEDKFVAVFVATAFAGYVLILGYDLLHSWGIL